MGIPLIQQLYEGRGRERTEDGREGGKREGDAGRGTQGGSGEGGARMGILQRFPRLVDQKTDLTA